MKHVKTVLADEVLVVKDIVQKIRDVVGMFIYGIVMVLTNSFSEQT